MSNETNQEGLNEIFAVTLKREVKNFPSEMDKVFYRKKLNVADDVMIAVFDSNGNWVTEF